MAFIVIVMIVAIALGAFFWRQDEPAREQAQQASLEALRDFDPALTLYGADGRAGIALDPAARALALVHGDRAAVRVPTAQLLGAELYRDGEKIAGVYRAGAAAQARLAEIATRTKPPAFREPLSELTRWQEVRRVELRVIVDAKDALVHDVRLLDRDVRDTDAVYREAVAAGEYWLARLDAAMR